MSEAKRQNICSMHSFTFMHLADAYLNQRTSRHVLSLSVFPGNQTYNLGVANTMWEHELV